ncbi:MAG: hypothetical protein ACFE92_17925 [Promethearchaeota archaeon]
MDSIKIITLTSVMSFRGVAHRKIELDVECKGSGLKEDPYIIDKSIYSAIGGGHLELQNSKKYFIIQNCDNGVINTANIVNSQNILIEDCSFLYCNSYRSSEITYSNLIIKNSSKISHCKNIEIKNCTISKLNLKNSDSILIKNSDVDKIKEKKSKNIILEKKS